MFPKELEILILPGRRFQVAGLLDQGPLQIVELKEMGIEGTEGTDAKDQSKTLSSLSSETPSLPDVVSQWTVDNVCQWLQSVQFDDYIPKFKKSHIDGELLISLTDDDLKNLGVDDGFHRKKILLRRKSTQMRPDDRKEENKANEVSASYIKLAHQYRKGSGTKQDYKEAIRLYQMAAAQGDSDGEAWLAFCYLQSSAGEAGGLRNNEEAFRLSKMGVEKKIPLAYRNLGMCYCYGYGTSKNLEEGIKLLQKGVELGNSYAQSSLGSCFYSGIGVTKDFKEAAKLYQLAARTDPENTNALMSLGLCNENGLGVEQDYTQAVRYYKLAADQGLSYAQHTLGNCYYTGRGVLKDYKEAIRFYRLAVEQGNAGAVNSLGNCYYYGQGVTKNVREAARLYRIAATKGNTDAQSSLRDKKLENL